MLTPPMQNAPFALPENAAVVTARRVVRFWELVREIQTPDPEPEKGPEEKPKGLRPSGIAEVAGEMENPAHRELAPEELLARFFERGFYRDLIQDVLFETDDWGAVEADAVERALGFFTSRWANHVTVLVGVGRISTSPRT